MPNACIQYRREAANRPRRRGVDLEPLVEIAQQKLPVRLGHGRANHESRDAWRMHHSLKSDSSPAVIARSAPSDCASARCPAASTR